MRLSIAKNLLQIADELDNLGFYSEAEKLTNLVRTAQIPGQSGWTPAPYTQVPQQPNLQQQVPQQPNLQQQVPQQPNLQQYQGGILPTNVAPVPPTTYNGPQVPYDPRYSPNTGQQAPPAPPAQNTNGISNGISNAIMNMPISPLTSVKTGPDGKPYVVNDGTMKDLATDYFTKSTQQKQQQKQQQDAKGIVENARQLQIKKELFENEERRKVLEQEQAKI